MELVRLLEGDGPMDFARLIPMPHIKLAGTELEWARDHWGSKWNAHRAKRQGYGRTGRVRYRFFTPYKPPLLFLDTLATWFRRVDIELEYDVEMLDCGRAIWRKGRLMERAESVDAR